MSGAAIANNSGRNGLEAAYLHLLRASYRTQRPTKKDEFPDCEIQIPDRRRCVRGTLFCDNLLIL